jgi:hypothetical protein
MARGVFIRTNSTWKSLKFPYVNYAGQNTKIKAGWTYQNDEWVQFWPPALPVTVVTIGAGGGRGGDDVTAGYTGNPGHRVTSTIGLSSSDRIIIGVGGRGNDGTTGTGNPGGSGGFGGDTYGGGPGGAAGALHGWSGSGGGGGGATYIEVNGSVIALAAGGGGGGGGGLGYVPPPPPPDEPPAINSPAPEAPPQNFPPPVPQPAPEPPPPEYPKEEEVYEPSYGDGIGDGPGDAGSDGAGSGCFTADTQILMADGTLKPIALVRVGERLQSDGGIVNVSSNRNRFGDVVLVSINGSAHYMTSNHAVLTDLGWAVYDINLLKSKESILYQQILADNGGKPLTSLAEGMKLAYWVDGAVEYRMIETLKTIVVRNAHVYWLNVSGDNHYVANGVVVHNDS